MSKIALIVILGLILTGCAPLLVAGGAVGGYAIAKNSQERSAAKRSK